MTTKTLPTMQLCEMADSEEADLFVLMTAKEEMTTRDGKPYGASITSRADRVRGC